MLLLTCAGAGQLADFDSAYDMGLASHALVRGVDCPWEAHYMDTLGKPATSGRTCFYACKQNAE